MSEEGKDYQDSDTEFERPKDGKQLNSIYLNHWLIIFNCRVLVFLQGFQVGGEEDVGFDKAGWNSDQVLVTDTLPRRLWHQEPYYYLGTIHSCKPNLILTPNFHSWWRESTRFCFPCTGKMRWNQRSAKSGLWTVGDNLRWTTLSSQSYFSEWLTSGLLTLTLRNTWISSIGFMRESYRNRSPLKMEDSLVAILTFKLTFLWRRRRLWKVEVNLRNRQNSTNG